MTLDPQPRRESVGIVAADRKATAGCEDRRGPLCTPEFLYQNLGSSIGGHMTTCEFLVFLSCTSLLGLEEGAAQKSAKSAQAPASSGPETPAVREGSSSERAVRAPKAAKQPPRATTRIEGFEVHYRPLEVPAAEPEEGLDESVIRLLSAELKSELPLSYGRTTLGPGEYLLRVRGKEPKPLHLELVELPRDAAEAGQSRARVRRAPARSGGEARTDAEKPQGRSEETGGLEKKDLEEPPAVLRVPLRLHALEPRSERLEVEVKSIAKGKKLRLVVRAGDTEAVATFSIKAAPAGEPTDPGKER
jgi:hypothetical protein